MPATTTQYLVLALFIALSSCATADELADPYDTQAMLPLKPSLRLQGAQGDPCTEAIVPSHPMSLFEVVDLALCNNPQTREVWASARVQAAQGELTKQLICLILL
jgi:hypothetical protein